MHVKKSFFLLLLSVGFLSSCSVSKSARQDRTVLNGYWILNNISYEGNEGKFNSVLFNDAEANCFEGSNWFFRNNNSTGSMCLPIPVLAVRKNVLSGGRLSNGRGCPVNFNLNLSTIGTRIFPVVLDIDWI